ncbi:hypothetical protein GM921_08340 [Pedobacter sp. LMG 31464]|uniref:Uncharacterized protein n=1 Tax=Pedobacter planticolens TaxID=2679964 RepID=A0A923DZV1_9SPHI|nr:hypothetical protein [Pedobacter planticolens]MBB2145488.1 hypothetical protein [Pedobacter planticolens]
MKISKLILNYQRFGDAKLDQKAQAVIVALTGNANFGVITATLADFIIVASDFATALTASSSRDRVAVSLKNDAREALLNSLRLMGMNIEAMAEGNRSKLVSSGFDLATESDNAVSLSPPQEFALADGMSPGEVKFSVKAVENAKSYIFEYTEEPLTLESSWISKGSSKREYTFVNLPSGKRIYGRAIAIGTRGQEGTTSVLTRMVQ